MPCLILTGYPCSGKTHLANVIRRVALEQFPHEIQSVVILTDTTACPDQVSTAACYADSKVEKSTRGSLKSEFDRVVNSNKTTNTKRTGQQLVILDSLNYIKGYRYELYCISKAAQERHAIVWVMNSIDNIQLWNQQRASEHDRYNDNLLQELVSRYEPPDSRNRWDSPLYTIDLRPNHMTNETSPASVSKKTAAALEIVQHSVYDMHQLRSELKKGTAADAGDDTTTSAILDSTTTVSGTTTKKSTGKASSSTSGFKRAVFKRPMKASSSSSSSLTPATSTDGVASHVDGAAEPSTIMASKEQQTKEIITTNDGASTTTEPSTHRSSNCQSLEQQVLNMLQSFLSSNNQPLQAGISTTRHDISDSNVLHHIDSVTLQVCHAIASAVATATDRTNTATNASYSSSISLFGDTFTWNSSNRTRSLAELKQLQRQYMHWVTTYPPDDTKRESAIVRSFLAYIETQR